MKNLEKKLGELGRTVSLNKEDKLKVKRDLILFMQKNPVRSRTGLRHISYMNNKTFLSNLRSVFSQPVPVFLTLGLLISGGASFAAENSLPGEALYAVKTKVNEPLQGLLAISEKSKAELSIKLATRRLEEAETLASEDELSEDSKARVEANFEVQANRVNDLIKKFQDKEDFSAAADVISNFEVSLRAHERILNQISEDKTSVEDTTNTDSVSLRVKARVAEAKVNRIKIEAKLSSNPEAQQAAAGKLKAAENKINEIRRFIEENKVRLGAEATVQAEARLKASEDLVVQGKVKLEAKAYGEAFVLFQNALSTAQAAKLLINARNHLNLEVNLNGRQQSSGSGNKKENSGRVSEENKTEINAGTRGIELNSKNELDFGF